VYKYAVIEGWLLVSPYISMYVKYQSMHHASIWSTLQKNNFSEIKRHKISGHSCWNTCSNSNGRMASSITTYDEFTGEICRTSMKG
jgi:hypothetical protein